MLCECNIINIILAITVPVVRDFTYNLFKPTSRSKMIFLNEFLKNKMKTFIQSTLPFSMFGALLVFFTQHCITL